MLLMHRTEIQCSAYTCEIREINFLYKNYKWAISLNIHDYNLATITFDRSILLYTAVTKLICDKRKHKHLLQKVINRCHKLGYPKSSTYQCTTYLEIRLQNAHS